MWQLFDVVTRPLVRGARRITPRVVIDRHLPMAAFLLLAFLWIGTTLTRIGRCVQIAIHLCK